MSDILSPHKQRLFTLFILKNKDVEWIRDEMRREYGVDASKSHYESKFRLWDFRKNFKVEEDWPWIDFTMNRLESEQQQGDVYFRGVLVPREKVRNQLARYQALRSRLSDTEPPKPAGFCVHVARNGSASSSPSDDEEAFLLAYSDLSTAFLAAAAKGYIHCMTHLIARGVDLNCKNPDGFGPLHLVARLDTQRDAGVLPPPRRSTTAHITATTAPADAAAAAKATATTTPFTDRFSHTWSEILTSLLLQAGADPNRRTTSGQTPLVVAVKDRAPVGLVRCLLDAGADPRIKFDGMAPVHFATINADLEVLTLLLSHHTAAEQVNALCIRGHTPLDYTRLIEWDHRPIVRLIKLNGGKHGPEVWPPGWWPVVL